jgi:hypothetical protein
MHNKNCFYLVVTPVACLSLFSYGAEALVAHAQAAAPQDSAASVQLQPYTAPDQSASAGLPPGWKVTKGEQTVIDMTGPQGETIFLGNTMIVRDAPFQIGEHPTGGIDLSMPNSSTLEQKFTMIVQDNAAIAGDPPPQLTIASLKPVQVLPAYGQCGHVSGTVIQQKGPMAFNALMCSLPLDSGGIYKVILKLAQFPASADAQESVLASQVFATYHISPGMLQLKLAPFTTPPLAPGAVKTPSISGELQPTYNPTDPECFDLMVIRETPTEQLPKKCGGTASNN